MNIGIFVCRSRLQHVGSFDLPQDLQVNSAADKDKDLSLPTEWSGKFLSHNSVRQVPDQIARQKGEASRLDCLDKRTCSRRRGLSLPTASTLRRRLPDLA